MPADTTCGGNPLIGRLFPSTKPVCLASASASVITRTIYLLPFLIPLAETTDSSLSCPNISEISLRSLRAVCAASNSTSTIILPAATCNPPAKRSKAETSALRQQGFVTESRPSSSFTASVIAIKSFRCM
ncbi:unannotated protein [freshwater metagenome]|uniref:Unannotated protein n=1 Tax=freshwater metagenome TaxID=449393 RepID=A0A6J6MF02_9ZZZZ